MVQNNVSNDVLHKRSYSLGEPRVYGLALNVCSVWSRLESPGGLDAEVNGCETALARTISPFAPVRVQSPSSSHR